MLEHWKAIWQPIETAPRDGDPVWLWYHACIPFRCYWDSAWMMWRHQGDSRPIKPTDSYQPTHWMRIITPDYFGVEG